MVLTRPPLYSVGFPKEAEPFAHDLHVLGAPLAFILSRDHTLSGMLLDARCAMLSTSQRTIASESDESVSTIPWPLGFVKAADRLRGAARP